MSSASPTVTAHRGSSAAAPENTLAAIRLAIEEGADLCEVDVFEAGDGTLAVLHDPRLDRVAGLDLGIWEIDGPRLATLDVGSWFGEAFRGEALPTLDQILETARGRVRLNVELKTHGRERDYVRRVVDTLRRHDAVPDALVTALDVDVLAEVRAREPRVTVGVVLPSVNGHEAALDVDLYSVERSVASPTFLEAAHRAGRAVHVWTVNTREELMDFTALGVDSLITDHPRLARDVVDGRRG